MPTEEPLGLTADFATDAAKRTQWKAFLNKNRIRSDPDLGDVISALRTFLLPPLAALARDEGLREGMGARRPLALTGICV